VTGAAVLEKILTYIKEFMGVFDFKTRVMWSFFYIVVALTWLLCLYLIIKLMWEVTS